MKKIPEKVLLKFEALAKDVFSDLKKKGHIVPIQDATGSIQFEDFIVKKQNNFYSIVGKNKNSIAENINLPQTAALLAHDLALGKILDPSIIAIDREYGYRLFDEEVYSSAANRKKNNLDQVIFYRTRSEIARVQKTRLKSRILDSFRKLTSIR
jgi:hypothetical protein